MNNTYEIITSNEFKNLYAHKNTGYEKLNDYLNEHYFYDVRLRIFSIETNGFKNESEYDDYRDKLSRLSFKEKDDVCKNINKILLKKEIHPTNKKYCPESFDYQFFNKILFCGDNNCFSIKSVVKKTENFNYDIFTTEDIVRIKDNIFNYKIKNFKLFRLESAEHGIYGKFLKNIINVEMETGEIFDLDILVKV